MGMTRRLGSLESMDCSHHPSLFRIKEHVSLAVSDEDFARRAERYPSDTPDTKEAYFIRETFESE
jgi:hypothetical protein